MADPVKLCKDCKHHQDQNCKSPRNRLPAKPNFVTGGDTDTPIWYGAQLCREDKNSCSPEALWFEPKVAA